MKKIIAIVVLLWAVAVFPQDESKSPEIPSSGKSVEAFIPKGWKTLISVSGDLNEDGVDDIALAVEDTDPEGIVDNPTGLDPKKINLNDRCLILLFKIDNGYLLAGHSFGFLPWENDVHIPCLADPLMENGGIYIKEGLLWAEFSYWVSCGSYDVTRQTFKFRHQENAFRLIGYDMYEFSRSSGEESDESINLVTGKRSLTTGGNMFDEALSKPVTIWNNINMEPIYLHDFGAGPREFVVR